MSITDVPSKRKRTTGLVGIAILGALVVIFDYTLKFSGMKIPFPWLPMLKFDFTGIPIVLSMLLYGLSAGSMTSGVACLAILIRSGDVIGATMKAIAELATILGMAPFAMRKGKTAKIISFAAGLIIRVLVMSAFNLIVLPAAYGWQFMTAVFFLPWLGIFNVMQGLLSIFGGYLIHEAIIRRIPNIVKFHGSQITQNPDNKG